MSEPTPIPWETSDTDISCPYRRAYAIRDGAGILAAMVQAPEDRDFIVRACNSHVDLLAALKEAHDEFKGLFERLSRGDSVDLRVLSLVPMRMGAIQAAIAKAENTQVKGEW